MNPRFVLISDHGAHGQRLARVLGERGIALEAVVFHSRTSTAKTTGAVQKMVDRARRRWGFYRAHRHFYSFLGTRVLFVDEMDGKKALHLMKRLAPDYILVGCGHILKQPLIEEARCGVLNTHPGLLPWMRGSGVVGHSLKRGVPVGATLHYIDVGIDTGAVIERRLLAVAEEKTTLQELESAAGQMAAEMMADAVEKIIREGHKPDSTEQTARFPLFRWYDERDRGELQKLASSGRALELFTVWKEHTNGAPQWSLEPDLMDAPEPRLFQN